jgi:hypothetical protein
MIKGWTIAEHFVERGVSGSIPLADRPEGNRMLATVGKGDVIVVGKLDRAFRSAADALTVLEELKAQGVGLHMIDLGGDVIGDGISKIVFTSSQLSLKASAIGCASASATLSATWFRKASLAVDRVHSAMTSCWMAKFAGLFLTGLSRL